MGARPRSLALAALALCAALGAAAPPARGVIGGTPVARSDRRFDCVGIMKGPGCDPSAISGSCVLIDAGIQQGGTLVRGALVLCAAHSLERAWGGVRVRFRRAVDGDDDGFYPIAATQAHCAGNYQEGGIRFVDGVARVIFSDQPDTATNPVMAVIELDTVIRTIRPAIIDPTPPFTLPDGVPLIVAGWGATDPANDGLWALRRGAARALSVSSGVGNVCPTGCADPFSCRACQMLGVTGDAGPLDLTCTGLGALHDSGAPIFRQALNPGSDERGGDLLLLGLDIDPPSVTGGYCRTYARTIWLWNAVVQQAPKFQTGIQPWAGGVSDFNRDGQVDLADLFFFLQNWFIGRPIADVAAPDGVDLVDVFSFLQSWFAQR